MAMKHASNVDECSSSECCSPQRIITVSATKSTHFQRRGYRPEVVISHHLTHLIGPRKKLVLGAAHDKSDGMYANSVRQLFTRKIDHEVSTPEVVLLNGGSCCRLLPI